jgi:hypothetical protein
MEEDQSAIPVAEGAIKSIKLSLSTEDEIVSSPSLMLFTSNACRKRCMQKRQLGHCDPLETVPSDKGAYD